jgi:hypothetical protein
MVKRGLAVLLSVSMSILLSAAGAWSAEMEAPEKGGVEGGVEREAALQMLEQFQVVPPDVQMIPLKKTYSIMHNEFDPYHQGISWASDGGGSNRYVSSCGIAVCGLEAPVHLPDGAHITGFSCKVLDNSPTHPVNVTLSWTKGDIFSYSSVNCMSQGSTTAASASIQTVDNTTCNLTVNNKVYAYALSFNTYEGGAGRTTCESGGKNCKVYTCYVHYY